MRSEVHHLLNRIRRRVRCFIVAEAALAVVLLAGVLFWLGLALDYSIEPSSDTRRLAWWFFAAGTMWLIYRIAWVRLRRSLPDRSIALLVERAHPELHECLSTSVAPVPAADSQPFLEQVNRQAAELSRAYLPGDVVSLKALRTKSAGAIALLASIVAFAIWQHAAFVTWIDRLALSESRWPRRVHLSIEGFEPDKTGRLVRRIPRFESTELIVRADLLGDYEAPSQVQITYWEKGHSAQRATLTRVGDAEKGRDDAQVYRFTFDELREPLSLEIRGGDDRLTNLYLDVLPRPRIVALEVNARFPAYLAMSPRSMAATSAIAAPTGTTLQFHGRASQRLDRIESSSTITGLLPPIAVVDPTDPYAFSFELPNLSGSGEVAMLPVDQNHVSAREPYVVTLAAQPDELPRMTVKLRGIGAAVTPHARIPVEIQAEDDHGVWQAWIELSVDDLPAEKIEAALPDAISTSTTSAIEVDLEARRSEVEDVAVQPGQQLSLVARARDGWNLTDEPRVGTSRIVTLDVVTADQLMESLEREEINLRKTFERVIERAVQGRQRLQRALASESESAVERLENRRIELARVLDDVQQVTDETLGVAGGFQLIYDQLVNNRIGDDELKSRLRERILRPLQAIGNESLPSLSQAIGDFSRASKPNARDTAAVMRTMQATIDQMQLVLEQMKSLETYGEVVAMLRTLIQGQQTLTDKTRKNQRQQLETLLLED